MIAPGLVYMGKGGWKKLLAEAKKRELDYLIVFSIDVAKNTKTGYVSNDTKMNVYNVSSGELITSSKKLNNVTVYRAIQEGESASEEVEKALEPVWRFIDEKVALQEMPNLTRENVANRIAQLLTRDGELPLQQMAEIRAYYGRGLIDDEELAKAYDILAGDQGLVLVSGSQKERRNAVARWMPSEQ
jgi:hypothetical protein